MRLLRTSCVDVGAPFEDANGVSFACAFERSDEASKACTYDQDIDSCLLIRPQRLSLHGGVTGGKCVRHVGGFDSFSS